MLMFQAPVCVLGAHELAFGMNITDVEFHREALPRILLLSSSDIPMAQVLYTIIFFTTSIF